MKREDFVFDYRIHKFICIVTGQHWHKAGVIALIGKDGAEWVMRNRGVGI